MAAQCVPKEWRFLFQLSPAELDNILYSESDNDIKRCIDASNTLILQVYTNADIQSHNLYNILYIGDHPMIPSHIIEDSSSGSNPTDDHGTLLQ